MPFISLCKRRSANKRRCMSLCVCASFAFPLCFWRLMWLQGRVGWESWQEVPAACPGRTCPRSAPLVPAEDFGQEGTWRSLVRGTRAVISFELHNESYKAQNPPIRFFPIQSRRIIFPILPSSGISHQPDCWQPPQIRGQISRTPFTSVEGCQEVQLRTWLVYLSWNYNAYLSLSANLAWRFWEPVFSHDSDISCDRTGWKYPVADVLVAQVTLAFQVWPDPEIAEHMWGRGGAETLDGKFSIFSMAWFSSSNGTA